MPLEKIDNLIKTENARLTAWFENKWRGLTPLPYFSCDIRHASYKIGVVDTNLFPAGFNNLCPAFTKDTAEAFRRYFDGHFPAARNVVLLGEVHTRNKFYLYNLAKLKNLIEASGRVCRVTMPMEDFPQSAIEIALDAETRLTIEKPVLKDGKLVVNGLMADLILSNNDFSSGLPALLAGTSTPLIPSPHLGWHKRTKGGHFAELAKLFEEFGEEFGLDPWQLTPITRAIDGVSQTHLAGLAAGVEDVLKAIEKKYAQYGVSESPFVFIKNDSGTYGLGIVTVASADELLTLNRKKREKLFATKGENQTHRFIVQEGIPTHDTYSGYPIEPVIYGVGDAPVGGFFRLHEGKTPFESLNAPGMSFSCLCLHKLDEPHEAYFLNCRDKQNLVTGARFMAKFAALAAALEARHLTA